LGRGGGGVIKGVYILQQILLLQLLGIRLNIEKLTLITVAPHPFVIGEYEIDPVLGILFSTYHHFVSFGFSVVKGIKKRNSGGNIQYIEVFDT